ncbi:short-chain dehydrogenase [Geobacillus genomosp. 3]|uniref:Short-chain dehydrogenase n=1 Tax=Geobacillus genomosp. 3 TaxID=1921421 RepID=S5ZNJ2_GEOG3|nr:SDR family NAD(P)-dependent oxidoreductase [Geobacillus genomosp. 3]AGT32008.1 short-chain dehydrogenase [Geobacillus genomosp. 3]
MRFSNAVAVVTGGGSGIGRATAIRLAQEGAAVVLVGRTAAKLEETAQAIERLGGAGRAEVFAADVTKREQVEAVAEYIRRRHGDLHVLVNNAGISTHTKWLELTEQEWDDVQQVNMKSVFLVSQTLAPLMIEGAKRERVNRAIVNVASLSGHQAGAHIPHYSAAKAGVISLTKSLALELAPHGIRVNSVSPGFVETPLTERGLQNERFVKAIERNTALRRVGTPEEIANVIAFLASAEASYMTGSDVLVDGGWLIT